MAEEHLDTAQVRAVLEKVGGEHVTENMRSYFARNARFDRIVFHDALHAPGVSRAGPVGLRDLSFWF